MKEIQRPCDFHQPGKKTPELTRAATLENKEDQCETEETGLKLGGRTVACGD